MAALAARLACRIHWLTHHNATRPSTLAEGMLLGDDSQPDSPQGYRGDDDFYVNSSDAIGDPNSPHFGVDHFFRI